jgi:hypothetical protein
MREADKNSSLTSLEFMPRNLDYKFRSRIPSQYPIDTSICSLLQWLKARPMWRAKQQEKNNAKFDNFAKEASTVFTTCIA